VSTLDNLRKEAKRWLKALRANDLEARARLDRVSPRGPARPGLRDVQHALAREHGHENWAAMIASIAREQADAPLATGGATHADRVSTFLEFACWDHHVHGKSDHRLCDRAALRLLEQHPEIARDSLFTAIVCGDVGYVRELVETVPAAATTAGGSRGWTPILYLCYARFSHPATIANAVEIGRLLLDRGANPNDFYKAGDVPYTALVGTAGEGEQDSPRQPQGPALFQLLLERGAEPFDMQVLYNTHFSGDVLWWLKLIEAHTRNTSRDEAWRDPRWSMLDMGGYGSGARFLLSLAIEKGNVELAEWLLQHGAGPNEPPATDPRFSKRSLYEDAVLRNRPEIADLLLRHGAAPRQLVLSEEEAFIAACQNGDQDFVRNYLSSHPEARHSTNGIFAAARANRADIVALLLDLGVSVDIADAQQQRPLHLAASHHALDVARLLIQRGAATDPRESRWDAAPIGYAAHHDDEAMLDLLSVYSRNVWTLSATGYVDRLRTILAEDPSLAHAVGGDNSTPLWWLPDDERKARDVVKLLLAHGADASARNNRGRTAADWARKRGMREVARILADAANGRPPAPPAPPPAASTLADYERMAEDWARAYESGDEAALERLNVQYGRTSTWDDVRAQVWGRVRTVREAKGAAAAFGIPEARDLVARDAGFGGWDAFAAAIAAGAPRGAFFILDAGGTRLRPTRTPTPAEWDALVAVITERKLTAVDANGTMTDRALARIAGIDHVTSLSLGGSRELSDEGLRHLVRMPQLEELNISEYPGGRITDRGLAVLRHLPRLRRFDMAWQSAISDEGVRNLRFCAALESVDLMGTMTGDATIAALRGKQDLRRLKTGRLVTDAGVEHLREIPLFVTPSTTTASCSLMQAESGPQHLLIDGPFTGRSVKVLAALSGVVSLSFFGHVSELRPQNLAPLAAMPNLQFFSCSGELCDDDGMRAIGTLPRLRMLLAQGTVATDEGFVALSRSRTLEYFWGRECPNLRGRGFASLARMPSIRGLAVSCKQVDDHALAALPRSPGLVELLPMDVRDEGFRYVGQCLGLESLWCMYCRETTDRATAYVSGLPRLRRYYAGASQITDRSLELLSRMDTLERIEIYECLAVSDQGLAFLAQLPRLREVSLAGLPRVTEQGLSVFPQHVHVDYLP
jgi:ankyrin repeat protein